MQGPILTANILEYFSDWQMIFSQSISTKTFIDILFSNFNFCDISEILSVDLVLSRPDH